MGHQDVPSRPLGDFPFSNDAQSSGDPTGLDRIAYSQFLENCLAVATDGVDADNQCFSHSLACHTLIDQSENLFLAVRQKAGIITIPKLDHLAGQLVDGDTGCLGFEQLRRVQTKGQA